jgi:stage IV sporulation protein FB
MLLAIVVWWVLQIRRVELLPTFAFGFASLILIHELGHAALVLRYRLGLTEIALHGAGGHCQYREHGTRFQEAMVAWGGIFAQLGVFIVAQLVLHLFPPQNMHLWLLGEVYTETNLWLAALNLIPYPPLDGARAWPLVGMLTERWRRRAAQHASARRHRTVQEELRALEKLDTRAETPKERTDRIVRELIERTTQPKDR